MEAVLLNAFLSLPWQLQLVLMAVCPIVTAASAYCASTPTPPPNTLRGQIYRAIEFAALLVGKAKTVGVPEPKLEDVQAAFLTEVEAASQQGRPIDLSAVAKALQVVKAMVLIGFVGAAVVACSSTTSTGISQPVITLAQVQNAATILLADIKADVSAYESANPNLDAATKADLDQSVNDLTSAVTQFTALPAGANYQVAANAVLNVANAVIGNLPASVLSANSKMEAQAAIQLVQAVLALIPPPAAS